MSTIRKTSWKTIPSEKIGDTITRQTLAGEKATLAQFTTKRGRAVPQHSHAGEEYCLVLSGALKYSCDGQEIVANPGDIVIVPSNMPHSVIALEDSVFIDFFAPARADWVRGEDQYLRE